MRKAWRSFDYILEFHWNDRALEAPVLETVLPNWEEVPAGGADAVVRVEKEGKQIRLELNGEEKMKQTNEENLSYHLRRISHLELATHAPRHVFVHSGVVQTEHGLLLIPARSYSGKSTLVKSLVNLGCTYFSDEYAVIDEHGSVSPFPRPHSERVKGGTVQTPAEKMGWSPSISPTRPAAVVVTRYEDGAVFEPVSLTPGESILKLLENTVSARTSPQKAISHLSKAVTAARCVESSRGESDEAAKQILRWMKRSSGQ